MKLEIVHAPSNPNWWKVTITVVDAEDFPTTRIFQDPRDYPESPDYVLFPANCTYISNVFTSQRTAKHWSTMQVDALAAALLEWRNPATKEIQFRYI